MRLITHLFFLCILLFSQKGSAQIVNIPDTKFLNRLILEGVDTSGDGFISYQEAADVKVLYFGRDSIQSIRGIEAFVNLEELKCEYNLIDTFDLTSNSKLVTLWADGNPIQFLDLSNNLLLRNLGLASCGLTNLPISNNLKLVLLWIGDNKLTKLDLTTNTDLQVIICWANNLTNINITHLYKLRELDCYANYLTVLDLSGLTELYKVQCSYNRLNSLILSNDTSLIKLECGGNNLTVLDISGAPNLDELNCAGNKLIDLNVKNHKSLINLDCQDNNLTLLDLSNVIQLDDLDCSENNLSSIVFLNNRFVISIDAQCNELTQISLTEFNNLRNLDLSVNKFFKLTVSQPWLQTLDVSYNPLKTLDISGSCRLFRTYFYNLPRLKKVCVCYMPFPQLGKNVYIQNSDSIEFQLCNIGLVENKLNFTNDLQIYPIPTNDILHIEFTNYISTDLMITVKDINGKTVLVQCNTMPFSDISLNVSTIRRGLYFLELKGNHVAVKKKSLKL